MSHIHEVRDVDAVFILDGVTKALTQAAGETHITQNDHNSEIITFKIPRFIEGHDMMLCDLIEVHGRNVNDATSAGARKTNKAIAKIKGLSSSPDDSEFLLGTWSVTKEFTQLAGTLSFKLKFACYGEEDTFDYVLNTQYCEELTIYESSDSTDSVVETNSEVIADLEKQVKELVDEFDDNVVRVLVDTEIIMPMRDDEFVYTDEEDRILVI